MAMTTTAAPRTGLGALFAENMRAEMARARVSGLRVAAALGIAPATVSQKLNGHRPITLDEAGAMAAVLGLSVSDLLAPASLRNAAKAPIANDEGLQSVRPEGFEPPTF